MPRLLSRIRPFFVITASVTTEICTLSLHDALPICHPPAGGGPHGAERRAQLQRVSRRRADAHGATRVDGADALPESRSEEHTSELQSHSDLVCRLLLEKKNATHTIALHPMPLRSSI